MVSPYLEMLADSARNKGFKRSGVLSIQETQVAEYLWTIQPAVSYSYQGSKSYNGDTSASLSAAFFISLVISASAYLNSPRTNSLFSLAI